MCTLLGFKGFILNTKNWVNLTRKGDSEILSKYFDISKASNIYNSHFCSWKNCPPDYNLTNI